MQSGKEGMQFKKLKWQLRARQSNYPSKRWGHTGVVYGNRLLIYGGSHSGITREPIYRINCQTMECEHIDYTVLPEIRESHSCNLINDGLFVFGGCINQDVISLAYPQDSFFPTLLSFSSPATCSNLNSPRTTTTGRKQTRPTPSNPGKATSLQPSNRSTFSYTGVPPQQKLSTTTSGSSTQRSSSGPKLPRSLACCSQNLAAQSPNSTRISTFSGGQFGEGEANQYSNYLYRISFSHDDFSQPDHFPTMNIQQVVISGIKPSPRTGHCCLQYKSRYLIVIGGEGVSVKRAPVLYNDMWVFDSKFVLWFQVAIQNRNQFRPRSNFTANIYKNTIIVFGGFINLGTFKCTDEILTVTLNEPKEVEQKKMVSLCTICKFDYVSAPTKQLLNGSWKNDQRIPADSQVTCSLHTILKIAQSIGSPLEALGLLISSIGIFPTQARKQLYLSICNTHHHFHPYSLQAQLAREMDLNHQYLSLRVTNLNFSKKQLQRLIYNYSYTPICFEAISSPSFNQETREILLPYLAYNIKTSLFRLGTQILFCYIFEDDIIYCYLLSLRGIFKFNLHRQSIAYEINQNGQYRILKQFLLFHQIKVQNIRNHQLHIVVSSMYKQQKGKYQVVYNQYNEIIVDIGTQKTEVYTLEKYMRHYWLRGDAGLQIFNDDKRIGIIPFEKVLKSIGNEHPTIVLKHIKSIQLQLALDQPSELLGIRIYHNNRYIGKLKKYFKIIGYIELHSNAQLNITLTRYQNTHHLKRILEEMVQALQQDSKKRSAQISANQLESQLM